MQQTTLNPVRNHKLFQDHYLTHRLQTQPEWSLTDHEAAFDEILEVYKSQQAVLKPASREATLEDKFFRPILKTLGFEYEVQERVRRGPDYPDYALFSSRADLESAHANRGTIGFYQRAVAVGEVKRWELPLDQRGKSKTDRATNPSFQIWYYLHETAPKWGILSNGRHWRLYHQTLPMDSYFEVDLADILERKDVDAFRHFYYFFRVDAFTTRPNVPAFLDRVLSGSREFATEVGAGLAENVYGAMRALAQGFFDWADNKLDPADPDHVRLVQENTLRCLYRLLFVLFSEGRGLFVGRDYYDSPQSLHQLKIDVADRLDRKQRLVRTSLAYSEQLKALFRIIDQGSEAHRIPRTEYYIPPYNGGLFDPKRNEFLERRSVSDPFLAAAIDLLARTRLSDGTVVFVDYSNLDIRHLGGIYEGLLEYEIKLAQDRMVAVGRDLKWKRYADYAAQVKEGGSAEAFESFRPEDRAETGEVYIATDAGARKASGSYYTPDHVVRQIVRESVTAVLDPRFDAARKAGVKTSDAVLAIKVLDPAMGSGHFLVDAVEYLAESLLAAIQEDHEAGLLTEDEIAHVTPDWARREVTAHCIYGVDLNELAVELAKVALWLKTISSDKPLNFLDHRLKHGNSLVGTRLAQLQTPPASPGGKKAVNAALPQVVAAVRADELAAAMRTLEAIPDETIENVKRKEAEYAKLQASQEYVRIRALTDARASTLFGNTQDPKSGKGSREAYYDLVYALEDPQRAATALNGSWLEEARRLAMAQRFFHWDLEFPDVFFPPAKEAAGFDVVLGNPPYIRAETADKEQRQFIMDSGRYHTAYGRFDVFAIFLDLGLDLCGPGGSTSMIVPAAILFNKFGAKLREHLLKHTTILSITDLRHERVFPGVNVEPIILTVKDSPPPADHKIRYQVPSAPGSHVLVSPHQTPQRLFLDSEDFILKIEAPPDQFPLKGRIEVGTQPLHKLCYFITGFVAHDSKTGASKDRLIHDSKIDKDCKPYIEAKDWQGRYSHPVASRWIVYRPDDPKTRMHRPKFPELFTSKKILVQRITSNVYMQATFDETGLYCNHSLNCCVKLEDVEDLDAVKGKLADPDTKGDPRYDLRYVLAVMASRTIGFYFNRFISSDLEILPETADRIPIRTIHFDPTKSNKERSRTLRDAAKAASYEEVLTHLDAWGKVDKGPAPAYYHDVLVTLSQRLLDVNREKAALTKQFADWVTSPAGLDVKEPIKQRDVILRFADAANLGTDEGRREIEKVVKSNKGRLSPKNLAALGKHYATAANKLTPLVSEAAAIDATMDEIVYRLYGLTEAERKVIREFQVR